MIDRNDKEEVYYVVSQREVQMKVAQALREKIKPKRSKVFSRHALGILKQNKSVSRLPLNH